jgi:hypothetical protein
MLGNTPKGGFNLMLHNFKSFLYHSCSLPFSHSCRPSPLITPFVCLPQKKNLLKSFAYFKENNKGMQEQMYNTRFNVETQDKKEK